MFCFPKLKKKNKLTHLDDLGELDRLLSSALEIINGEDLHARVVDELAGSLHVGTLETGNDGDLEVQRLDRVDETVGDGVAADDTTENVDKDGGNLGVAGDELEGLPNGRGGSTTTDVKEVGGLATVQLDDVHGSHGETGTVDKAANVTIELDEVEAGLGGANLIGILLGGVAELEDVGLPEISVVIEAELGVHGHDLVVRGLGKRVDLDLGGILLAEDLVELLDGVLGLLDALLAEAELGGDVAGHLIGDTDVDVDVGGVDGFGVLLGDTLNVHATLGRRNNDGALRSTVHEDGEVELAASELALADVDSAAETTLGASLLGDELVADHLLGEHLGLGGGVDDANTALEAVVEGALSTATSKNLGLDDHVLAANLLGDGLGLGAGPGDITLGNTDAILLCVVSR